MTESRTKNSIRNMGTGIVVQVINIIMEFVVRTVFIQMLNAEYLGVNGLFANILTMLSFAELGIGTAIIFNMYKPVAENDQKKIKALMNLYKKAYNIIGIVIFVLGLCVIPFMGLIIKDAPNISENLIFIYILFLINTSSSYFFIYKRSIIAAHQKQSVLNNIDSIFYIIRSIVEIIFLVITKNFAVFLIIKIVATISENIIVSHKADKMYPYLKNNNEKLDKKETKGIFANVRSLIVYKFGSVIMDGTDNILISSMINVETVGFCSNYTLLIGSVKNVINSALKGVTASIGNLNAVESKEIKERVFYQLTFINYIIYSFCTIAFIVLLTPFIKIWLGGKYTLSLLVVISLAVSFFITGLRNLGYTYRVTMGLFRKGKITPYIGAISNIIFSIVLCHFIGLAGIFIATSISQLLSYSWIDPYLIHKYEFKTSAFKYFKKFVIYFASFSAIALLTYVICDFIAIKGILGFIIKCFVVLLIPNILNLLLFMRTDEFKQTKRMLKNIH